MMNIYEKIAAIMQDVQYLAKDDHVEFGSTKYKALSEEKVTSIMRAELLKHKLVVYPIAQTAGELGTLPTWMSSTAWSTWKTRRNTSRLHPAEMAQTHKTRAAARP